MQRFLRVMTMALLLTGGAKVMAEAAPEAVEAELDNGMKVIVVVDRRSPVVTHQVWYKVGSSYEPSGVTGMSHALEHMMFKGTDKLKPGEFSEIVARNGGRENAFTSRDYTAYFQTIAADRLPLMMQLEADRMVNLHILDEEFAREIEVIKEERRMRTDDQPRSKLFEQFHATAMISSPARHPIIGWRADLDSMTADDLRDWYTRWYTPNNATLVVVGDVDPQHVIALAGEHYGKIAAREVPPPKPQGEIAQLGERRLIVNAPAQVPYLLMGYRVPTLHSLAAEGAEDWEPYALDLLAGVLDGGDSARLATTLVRGAQIASQAGAGYDLYDRGAGLFLLDGTPAPGVAAAQVESALLEQVERVRADGVSADELKRVKAQIIAEDVYQRDSIFYSAMKIGTLETVGLGRELLDEYIQRVRAITPEQVQAVAQKYLISERLTVGHLQPVQVNAEAQSKGDEHNG